MYSPIVNVFRSGSFRRFSLVAGLLFSSQAHALGVEPMIFELEPLGGGARTTMSISNNATEAITIEAIPRRLRISEDGEETLTDAADDILIFPPLAEIPPGQQQILQVQYIGDPEIATSVAYRVSIEQVPIDWGDGESGSVGLSSDFHTLLNIVPSGTQGALSVTRIRSADGDKLELDIENTGTRFVRLTETQWTIRNGDEVTSVTGRDMRKLASGNLVLPGTSRRISFKSSPEGVDLDGASITIDVE